MKLCALRPGLLALVALLVARVPARGDEPVGAAAASNRPRAAGEADFNRDVVPFLAKHCYSCHGNGKRKADLALDSFRDELAIQENREIWENVLEMVRTGEMPPKPRPKPADEETEAALGALDDVLARFDCTGPRNAGRVTLRRLNRVEYNNTIRDLVGIDFKPAADFPNDDVGYGFDNIGDVLSLSPLLLEKYLAAAEAILDRAIVIMDPPAPTKGRLSSIRTSFGAGATRGRVPYLHSRGSFSQQNFFEEGDYTFRATLYCENPGDEPARATFRLNDEVLREFEVKGDRDDPTTIEEKVRLKSGTTRVSVSFLNPTEIKT